MAINVSALNAYVDEKRLPLLRKAVLEAESAKDFNLITGIKGATALNILDSTIVFGDGSQCGWDPAGSDALSQRVITPGYVKVNKDFCEKTLLKTWANYEVKVAAGHKTLPFAEDFIESNVEKIAQALETAIWQGDTESDDANLKQFDGIIKIAEAATLAQTVTYSANDSKLSVFNQVISALPYEVYNAGDVVAYCGHDVYDALVQELIANGNIVINAAAGYDHIGRPAELVIPGTRVTVKPKNGLNGTGKIFASYADNFVYGTDLTGDEEKVEFWYSQDHREFRLAVEFVAATQLVFPALVVEAKLA